MVAAPVFAILKMSFIFIFFVTYSFCASLLICLWLCNKRIQQFFVLHLYDMHLCYKLFYSNLISLKAFLIYDDICNVEVQTQMLLKEKCVGIWRHYIETLFQTFKYLWYYLSCYHWLHPYHKILAIFHYPYNMIPSIF